MNSGYKHSVRNPRVLLLGCLGSLVILLLLAIA